MKKSSWMGEFCRYVSLNVVGMLGLSFYILADTYFISLGLGTNGLAALNLAIPVYSFMLGCGQMVGMGGGIKFAILKNQENRSTTDRIFTTSLYLGAAVALALVLLGLFGADAMVTLMGADQTVYPMTRTYLRVLLLFSPAFILNNILLPFVRNDGQPQLAMAAMIGGSLSNVVLDYLFIFPCKMGILGAVVATGFSPIISMAILSPHFIRKKHSFHLTKCRWRPGLSAGILSAGAPSLITELSSGVVILAFNAILLGLEGNSGVAAYGVIANLSLVVTAIYSGIAQGVQPILSSSYGRGEGEKLRAILRYALTAMLALSAAIYLGMYLGAGLIAAAFNNQGDPLLQSLAVQGLKIYFLACPFVGFNIILAAAFAALEQPRPAQVISLLRGFFLILPVTFLLSRWWGALGVWWAFPVTEALVFLAAAAFRKTIRIP